jgi:hypothetical protein
LIEQAGRLKDAIERILGIERTGDNNSHTNARNSEELHRHTNRGNNIEADESDDSMLENLRELILEDNEKDSNKGNPKPLVEEDNSTSPNDVAVVFRFWKKLTALLSTPGNQSARHSIMDVLSGLPWCPELVGRLAIALSWQIQGQRNAFSANNSDSDNHDGSERGVALLLPLHRCVRSLGGGGVSQPRGMLPVLCKAHPFAASVPDPTSFGRLPFQMAVAFPGQHSWEGTLQHLFAAYPASVAVADPVTGLPAFCLAGDALAPITDHETEKAAKTDESLSNIWYYLSKRDKAGALENVSLRLECQKLTVMFEVLRKDPSVLKEYFRALHRGESHELTDANE